MQYDIVVVGAGFAGLTAARKLSAAGYSICVLEAAASAGGRATTLQLDNFDMPVKTGAEFIHGNLPHTMALLHESGIAYDAVEGKMITVNNGKWNASEEHSRDWPLFMQELHALKEDCSVQQFLDKKFPEATYAALRLAVRRFAEGFDLADIEKASMLALKEEWSEDDHEQYRVKGGYVKLVNYLLEKCLQNKVVIKYSTTVDMIEHSSKEITAITAEGERFIAKKVIVTVPLAILQSGALQFIPALPNYEVAIHKMAVGSVIKILLQFGTAFWKNKDDDIGFLLSDQEIPTWWTQAPSNSCMLTGWLGGPKALLLANTTSNEILNKSLASLANILQEDIQFLRKQLKDYRIICWSNQPNIQSGYSYDTTTSAEARAQLLEAVNNTIYFAGEAFFNSQPQGTVEAAIHTGITVAELIMRTK